MHFSYKKNLTPTAVKLHTIPLMLKYTSESLIIKPAITAESKFNNFVIEYFDEIETEAVTIQTSLAGDLMG